MFIDEVRITVKAGDGGNGCLAFRREKYVPRGGPSGGDGGRGGDVVMVASQHHNTLLHFRFNPEHKAERGRHGEGSNRTGREGESIELSSAGRHHGLRRRDRRTALRFHEARRPFRGRERRPRRTRQRAVRDLDAQAPTEHEHGKPGEERRLRLELKLLADVGLVGFPERRQVDADLAHFRRAAQDRRLSVHYARTESGRGAAWSDPRTLRGGRYSRPDRRRARGRRAGRFSS